MNYRHRFEDGHGDRNLRGFIAFIAVALWFLLVILGAGRASAQETLLTARDVTPALEAALFAHGAPEDAVVHLDNPGQPVADGAVAHTSYNPLSGRFVIRMAEGGAITGIAARMARYAIVNRDIERGEIIGDADIASLDSPAISARGLVMDERALSGKMARRTLAANKPIRAADLETPTLVKKGAIVTLTYQVAGIRMTHQGIAMHNGGAGDIVSVKNIKSDRTLKGVVSDRNLVSIIPHNAAFEG